MAATYTPNLNLNKPDRADLVSVVTDINDNMDTLDDAIGALPVGLSLQGQINTLKPITITIDPVTNASGAYTHTTTDSRVTEGLKAVEIEVGTPETFKAPIRITTGNGTIELYCANAVGSSTVVVTLEESTPLDSADPQPASVTSTEFDILANRIGTLSNLHTTNKTSLVDATNEVSDQIANKLFKKLSATTDLNSITDDGIYLIDWVSGGSNYHRPSNAGGRIEHSTSTSGNNPSKQQVFITYTGLMYVRGYTDGAWTGWNEATQLPVTQTEANFAVTTNDKGVAAVPSDKIPTIAGRTRLITVLANFTSSELSTSQIPPTVVETSTGSVYILGSPNKTYNALQLKGLFI